MKSISNSDFSLLVEKLPVLIKCAREGISSTSLRDINALRQLTLLHKKLERLNPINKKQNDKK